MNGGSRRHHNLFMSYRSRAAAEISKEGYSAHVEGDIEDNVTKSLINVLEFSGSAGALRSRWASEIPGLRLLSLAPSAA